MNLVVAQTNVIPSPIPTPPPRTNVIPPSTEPVPHALPAPAPQPDKPPYEFSKEGKIAMGEKAFWDVPKEVVKSIGKYKEMVIDGELGRAAERTWDDASKVVRGNEIVYKLIKGAKEGGEGNYQGLLRESLGAAAAVAEDAAADWMVKGLAKGMLVGAEGALGLSYSAGSIVGAAIREDKGIGKELGLSGSIGDVVDKNWFKIAPDSLKEAISGTRQYDPNSYEAKAEEVFATQRLRREHALNKEIAKNKEVRERVRNELAAERGEVDAESNSRSSRGTGALGFDPRAATEQLKQISADLTARQQQQQMMIQQQRLQQQQPAGGSGASGYYGAGGIYPNLTGGGQKPAAPTQGPKCHPREMIGSNGLPRCPY
jgi:hypothetical protein